MGSRRLALRLSLVCLAVTAASALLMLVLPVVGVAGRLTLSALFATVAGLICIPFAGWAVREEARWAGLMGVVWICAQLLLGLSALWLPLVTGVRGDSIAFTMLDLLFVGGSLLLGARAIGSNCRSAAAVLLGTAVLAFILMQIDSWGTNAWWRGPTPGGFDSAQLRGSAFTLIFGGWIVSACLIPAPTSHRRWPLLGVIAGSLAAGIALQHIGVSGENAFQSVAWLKATCTSAAVGVVVGAANLLFWGPIRERGVPIELWTRRLTFAAITGATSALLGVVWTEDSDPFGVPATAFLVISLCGALGVALLARFRREPEFATDGQTIRAVEIRCPRCRTSGEIPLGLGSCRGCGLRFRVSVEEPACEACGRLMIGVLSDRCPECGEPLVRTAEVVATA